MQRFQRLLVPGFLGGRAALGLLILRLVVGLAFALHGYPKMQHPAAWMTLAMGPRAFAPAWLQAVAAIVEFCGGIALMLGALTPLTTALIACDMLVAVAKIELPSGAHFVGGRHSYELNAVYLAAMALLFLCGPGLVSVDGWIALILRGAQGRREAARPRHWR